MLSNARVKNIREAYFDNIFNVSSVAKKNAANLRKLCNVYTESLQALKNLGEPVNQWNSWLVYHCKKKLDAETRFEWEKVTANNTNPTFSQMQEFLNDYAYALEASEEKAKRVNYGSKSAPSPASKCLNVVIKNNCFLCDGDHRLAYCPDFTRLDAQARKAKIIEMKLCINCFSRQHFVSQCPKPSSCGKCKQKHHPTLHVDQVKTSSTSNVYVVDTCSTLNERFSDANRKVFLATAVVIARSSYGGHLLCRVLIDPGSQSSFITSGFAQRLRLKKTSLFNGISVQGIGGVSKGTIDRVASVNLSSKDGKASVNVEALVIDSITSHVPQPSTLELD